MSKEEETKKIAAHIHFHRLSGIASMGNTENNSNACGEEKYM